MNISNNMYSHKLKNNTNNNLPNLTNMRKL